MVMVSKRVADCPEPLTSCCRSTEQSSLSTAVSGTDTKAASKYVVPKTNVEFWQAKVARNIERDLKSAQILDTLAWTFITVWECELTKKNQKATINRIEADLRAAKEKYENYCASVGKAANKPENRPESTAKSSLWSRPNLTSNSISPSASAESGKKMTKNQKFFPKFPLFSQNFHIFAKTKHRHTFLYGLSRS